MNRRLRRFFADHDPSRSRVVRSRDWWNVVHLRDLRNLWIRAVGTSHEPRMIHRFRRCTQIETSSSSTRTWVGILHVFHLRKSAQSAVARRSPAQIRVICGYHMPVALASTGCLTDVRETFTEGISVSGSPCRGIATRTGPGSSRPLARFVSASPVPERTRSCSPPAWLRRGWLRHFHPYPSGLHGTRARPGCPRGGGVHPALPRRLSA